jgi:cAMP phosphodiesterase
MFELLLRGLGTESVVQTMDVLLEHLRSLPVREQAPVAVLLLHLEALVWSFNRASLVAVHFILSHFLIHENMRCYSPGHLHFVC